MAENKKYLPDTRCLRQLFGIDLKGEIENKTEKGHQILLMGGFNSEYKDLIMWMLELGLIGIITKKYGLVPINQKYSKDAPLDYIFGSVSFQISKGVFLSFGKLMSDHRGVCLDIP